MQFKFFKIPVNDDGTAGEAINAFMRSNVIIDTGCDFVADGANSFWAIRFVYGAQGARPFANRRPDKIDYRDELNAVDFTVFLKMRERRKKIAENLGIPAYAVFTDEQMAQIITSRVKSESELKKITGVNESRAKKFGEPFLEIMKQTFGEAASEGSKDEAKSNPTG